MKAGIKQLLAAAVVGLSGVSANAAMTITSTRVPGTGDLAGFDIVRFFAAAAENGPEKAAGTTGLFVANVELSTPTTFKFLTGQFAPPNNGAANPDVDLFGAQSEDTQVRTTTEGYGTYIGLRDPDFDPFFVAGLKADGVDVGASKGNSSATNNPSQFFANVKSFRVEGVVNNTAGTVSGDPQVFSSSVGQKGAGAIFAVAVVPTNATARAIGEVGGNAGPTTTFDETNAIPEPGTFGLLGLTVGGMLMRRRRQA
jgi:hypothetical protein